jgi:hypothetical protein
MRGMISQVEDRRKWMWRLRGKGMPSENDETDGISTRWTTVATRQCIGMQMGQ